MNKKFAAVVFFVMLCLSAMGAHALTVTGLENETVEGEREGHKLMAILKLVFTKQFEESCVAF